MSIDNTQLAEATSTRHRWMKGAFSVFVVVLACALYQYFFVMTAYVEVELTVSRKADFKIYWAAADKPFSEKCMAMAIVSPDRKKYGFFLTDIGKIARLRIDPHNYQGEATVKSIVVRQEGYAPIVLADGSQFEKLTPLHDIAEFRADDDGLWVKSTGNDANFELLITPEHQGLDIGWVVLRLLIITIVMWCFLHCAAPLATNLRFVPVLLFGVWVLIITMAGISKDNVHPDEYVHFAATAFYQNHWLPPLIDDPAIRNTYSAYGVSRLNNGEVYYLFAGKVHTFMQSFKIPEYFSLRLFNVSLFGFILLYAIRNRYARMVALPFLISPQIWYLFSYCASDAFALFVAFLAACELIDPDSLLHRYLKGDSLFAKLIGPLALGLLLGIVFLLKANYAPFVVFFYLVLGAKLFCTDEFYWDKKAAILRLVLITLIGAGVFGVRVGADYLVNGFDRGIKIARLQEELAHSWYKPSTELHKKHVTLYKKARGTTLEKIVMVDRWLERSFQSSFGSFGYFTISGTQAYYDLVRWSGALLFFLFFAAIFRGGGWLGSGLAVATLGLAAGLIGVSLYHSWTLDFQAQGRYLFPVIPMLGILYGWNFQAVNGRLMLLAFSPMFIIAAYAFIFEALMRIPRVIFQ